MKFTKRFQEWFRGPHRVVRDGPRKWKIVNADREDERLGFPTKEAADEVCRLMNGAHNG